jgi:16S rRNA processing protein RimM
VILLAVVTSAHGIQGAVKVKTFTEKPEGIFSYGQLQDEGGRAYALKLVRLVSEDSLIATIEDVRDRSQAEALRGLKLYVERDQLPTPLEEEFYHTDLIGLLVQTLEGDDIGHVRQVNNFGAGDFLEIVSADHHVYTVPFTREAVPVIRLPEKGGRGMVQIDSQFFLDAANPQGEEGHD